MARMGKFIDLSKCIGCRGCQVACKQWNKLPAYTRSYTAVQMKEHEANSKFEWHFRKHQCMHCAEPTCVMVCPHNARNKMPEGIIYQNSKCIGCGYCAAKCPYQACTVDKAAKRSYSCWMCYDRITNGMDPACVKGCPTTALVYGDRDTLVAQAQNRLSEVRSRYPEANLYGLKAPGGGLGVIYLLLKDRTFYGLPDETAIPDPNTWYGSANGVIDCYTCHAASTVTYPGEGQTVSGWITVTGYADTKSSVSKVEYYLDNSLIGSSNSAPYSLNIDTTKYANGLHTIKAKAIYTSGSGKANITNFYISNQPSEPVPSEPSEPTTDTTAPNVAIISPTSGSLRGVVTIKINATDNVGIARVELYLRDKFVSSKTASPYDFAIDTRNYANGKATIKAVAIDTANNSASTTVNVKINN